MRSPETSPPQKAICAPNSSAGLPQLAVPVQARPAAREMNAKTNEAENVFYISAETTALQWIFLNLWYNAE
jgi:hypothetical protein